MIPPPNCLYFSHLLPVRHPRLWQELTSTLAPFDLPIGLLPNTRDVWAVDYMPVQVSETDFVQFRYEPGYLLPFAKHRVTITDPAETGLPQRLPSLLRSSLRLDGGNVVRAGGLVLVCDKVLDENPVLTEGQIRQQLAEELRADRLILLPTAPGDIIGHADGMVYLLDERTALVNDYHGPEDEFGRTLRRELRNSGLAVQPFPYNPYRNDSSVSAQGIYLNFVKLPGLVLLPAFGLPEDETAFQATAALFPTCQILSLPCADVAALGGVLHCLTWAWHNLSL